MKRVQVVQVGIGTVGGEVISQIVEQKSLWEQRFGLHIVVAGVVGRQGGYFSDDDCGIPIPELQAIVKAKRDGGSLGEVGRALIDAQSALEDLGARGPVIVMDAAAGDESASLDVSAIEAGGGAVLSNKAPMALPITDTRSTTLWGETGTLGRVRYETTCGAGLPIISTLRNLLDTGDEILEITGSVSGTFGAIFSDVSGGKPFSRAIIDAKANGYTEPDPRDDLSGLDVARKALILARTIGRSVDLSDIIVESLVPEELQQVSLDEFLQRVGEADQAIGDRVDAAKSSGETLKYVATVAAGGPISVGLKAIRTSTVLGALQGPENIVSIRTKRYDRYQLTVTGPGAGAAVTAAGMIGDMLDLAVRFAGS